MADEHGHDRSRLVAELNDVLQLDHDAVEAYTVAIDRLGSEQSRRTVTRFRGDHERHVEALRELVAAYGGTPLDRPHVPTGAFKLAVQKAGAAAGGDTAILLAFKANEGQVRDRYRRAAAAAYPSDVSALLRRNAADEERHYAWVTQALEALGAGAGTALGKAGASFESVHRRTSAAIESGERQALAAAGAAGERARELGDAAQQKARRLAGETQEALDRAGERARDGVSEAGGRALDAAGAGLDGVAVRVDRAADWAKRRGGAPARASAPLHRVADTLRQESRHLRDQDLDAVKRDVEGGVRAHPIRSVLIAVGLGYVVGRLLGS